MGVLRVFVVLGGGGGGVGGAGLGLSPCVRAAHSLAERGVFIYYLWRVELSQDMEGAGGRCWWDVEGVTRVSPAHPGFACAQNGAGKATAVAGGSRDGAGGAGGPGIVCVCVPSGDPEVSRGSISAGEHPTLSPGFPSPPCAAFWLWLPIPRPLGLGEEGRGVLGSPWAELETHFHFYCHLTSLCSSELCV